MPSSYYNSLVCSFVCMYVCNTCVLIINNNIFQIKLITFFLHPTKIGSLWSNVI